MNPRSFAAAAAVLAWYASGCSADTASTGSGATVSLHTVCPVVGGGAVSPDGGATSDGGPDGAGASPGTSPTLLSLTVSSGSLVPAFSPDVTDYTMTSLNGLHPIEVTATASDPAAPLVVHGQPATSGAPQSFTLSPCEDFTVVLGATTYTVHYMPPDLSTYTVTTSPAAGAEDVLLTPNGTYLLVVDRAGQPLYYRTFQPDHVENFEQNVLPSGATVYSTQVGPVTGGGTWSLGTIHLMDAQFGDIDDVSLLPNRSHGALPAEGHDFILIDQDHYVLMSYVQRTQDLSGLNPAWSSQAVVMNAVVQEIDGDDVVFEWDSADVPSLYTDSTSSNTFTSSTVFDYLHMNSMTIDPTDGNFIFSFRFTSSIVKIDRTSGDILWTLGGKEDDFGLTPDQVFSWQHYVRRQPDGSLWVFDNGNNLHQTRIVSFLLDEDAKTVTSFTHVYDKPADQPQTSFMGAYTRFDGSRELFGWGGWNEATTAPSATEVAGGTVAWSLTFDTPGVFSYRALAVPPL